ncbi:dsDNA nuclease domain-containing protein [Devosia sp.]|uniref:dsDNA nuclease domain-containing protein n=1 Tax=Devosia sp. TaxID=1871048 RepID=UPI0019E869C3|nr:dsDNA nuclease domain-containing protein [Devosia sp.]MBE0581888.1 DUF4297 domain-containing protein [Devosia sp.]
MTHGNQADLATVEWPSVDLAKPAEEGGPNARAGFNYQDEIAVGFFLEMLELPSLLKIHCETHDDIVLVRQGDTPAGCIAEFVQVKASEQDKLWSVADLCQRKKSKAGTSIFEGSLGRDKHNEIARFRLVTLRPVVTALEPLTLPLTAAARDVTSEEMVALNSELTSRFPDFTSPKGNVSLYWLRNCLWDQRHSEKSVQDDNLVRLVRHALKTGANILFEQAEILLQDLRLWAKTAGDAKWDKDPAKKIITRDQLLSWWESRIQDLIDGLSMAAGGKLADKMDDAQLPDELVGLALDLRRSYAAESRAPRYLDPGDVERLQRRVQSEVMSLRARYVAGQIDVEGSAFHALCLDRMDEVNSERSAGEEDRSAFLKGCMYDIADRCLLRFARPGQ